MIGIDADVWGMVTAMRAANQVCPSYQMVALSNFAKRAKANSYWTKLLRADFFPGDKIISAGYPIKYPTGTTQVLTSVNGLTDAHIHRRMGLTGVAAAAMFGTSLNPTTLGWSTSTLTVGMGIGYLSQSGGGPAFGCLNTAAGTPYCFAQFSGANAFQFAFFTGTTQTIGAAGRLSGFYVGNRKSSGLVNAWKDGVSTLGDTADAVTGAPNVELYIAGRNNGGGANQGLDGRMFSCLIGQGMSDADIVNMSADHAICMSEMRRVL